MFRVFRVIKNVAVLVIIAFTAYMVILFLDGTNNLKATNALMATGSVVALIGFLASITRNGRVKVGNINRAEFYGLGGMLIGYLIYMHTLIIHPI